jgi:hypothetical protein
MKKNHGVIILLLFLFTFSFGQDVQDVALFKSKDTVNIRATGSIKKIKKNSNDSTLVTGKFEYEKNQGEWINVPMEARVRGNFRLENCYFPPLKLKFKKKDVASTLFEGNKALKLVVPCISSKEKNSLILKEYLCYQFYKIVSPYFFNTRLAHLELTEVSKKKPRTFSLLTFFVEDNSLVANRADAKLMEGRTISPLAFDEKQSVRNDFFQYMIGNADWSAVAQHNSNTLFVHGKYVPLSYDFDMAGFVNAGYARSRPPTLGTGDVRERVYRGFCKSTAVMEEIRKEFLEKEPALHAAIDEYATSFSKFDLNDMHDYMNEFFDILKSDPLFKTSILNQCRTM